MTNHADPVALIEQVYDHAEGVLVEIGPDHHELHSSGTEGRTDIGLHRAVARLNPMVT